MKNRMKSDIFNPLFSILLFFMIAFSAVLMNIKIILLLLIIFIVLLKSVANPHLLLVDKRIFTWFFIYIGSNTFFIFLSVFNMNQGALNTINIGITEPILYFIIILYVKENNFWYLWKCIRWLFIITCIYNIVFAMAINNLLPLDTSLFLGIRGNFGGVTFGFIKISPLNSPWLYFLLPCFFSKFFVGEEKAEASDYIIVVLGLINAVLILSTAFLLGIAITPVICLLLAYAGKVHYNRKNIKKGLVFLGVLCLCAFVFNYSLVSSIVDGVLTKIQTSFTLEVNDIDSGGNIRLMQAKDLILTWLERPIFGWGASANALHVIRSETEGAYELTYLALLMQKGIIGFSIFWLQIFWIYREGIHIIKKRQPYKNYMMPILVGFTIILLANGTNPYIGSFDRLLILFLPLMILNLNYRSQHSIMEQEKSNTKIQSTIC